MRKQKLRSPPILTLPKNSGQYTLPTDACDRQIGCVLLQIEQRYNEAHRPLVTNFYWSREESWHDAPQMLRCHLCCITTTLLSTSMPICPRTNHHALRCIHNLADTSGKLALCRLRLLDYYYEIVHRAGMRHQAGNVLSRLHTAGAHNSEL